MSYSVSIDSGGSKTLGILYDSDFRMISKVRTGSMRGNSTPPELVQKHLEECMNGLFGALPGDFTGIDTICGSVEGAVYKAIQERYSVKRTLHTGEAVTGLAAAGLREGLVALSGTGATMYLVRDEKGYAMGGYGAVLFDEGSGYHIGRMGFAAAVRWFEKRGEYTSICDKMLESLDEPALNGGFFQKVYGFKTGMSPVAWVASLSKIVAEAAVEGDAVAQEILRKAGQCLGDQMLAMIRRHEVDESLPLTVSGSVYKGSRIVFDELCRTIRRENPRRPIVVPLMEPVVGAMMYHYMIEHGGELDTGARLMFRDRYPEFVYQIGK